MNRLSSYLHTVSEQFGDMTRSLFPTWSSVSGIRFWGQTLKGLRFWPASRPTGEGSIVNYDITRSLYRNDGENALGGAFAKPIVDLQVAFIGLPHAATDDTDTTDFLNDCIGNYWRDEIQQLMRDAIRDSKTIVRIHRPDILDPLMTIEEARHGSLEIIAPENVDIERNGSNKRIIERAVIRHRMVMVIDDGDPTEGRDPQTEEHDVIEIIDRQSFRFFDQMTHSWIDSMNRPNPWNFVPLLEVHNEWDAALQGGQSDLETVIPFINAFHDVVTQGLQAHGYHSTPKIVMNLADSAPFIKMNFPEAVDEATGELKESAEISWRGREIIFLQIGDEVHFLEANSVLGDTRVLAEFLIDCICIASQTPEWAFMRVDSGSANSDRNAQTVPFVKKIDRKRNNYIRPIQELLKMILVINDLIPVRATISWEVVRADDEVVFMQAFQQLIMGLEVAAARGEISDQTYRETIRKFLPAMKGSAQEAAAAAKDSARHAKEEIALANATAPAVIGGPQGRNE